MAVIKQKSWFLLTISVVIGILVFCSRIVFIGVIRNELAVRIVTLIYEERLDILEEVTNLGYRILRYEQTDLATRRLLALVHLRAIQIEKTDDVLVVHENDCFDPITCYLYGEVLLAYGDIERAIAVWRTIGGMDQHFAFRGDAAYKQGDIKDAMRFYDISWRISDIPNLQRTTMFLNLCRENRNHRDMVVAIYWCKQATASRDNYWTKIELGRTLYEAADYKFAEKVLRETISSFPEAGDAYYYLGMTLRKSGKEDEGIKALSISANMMPTSVWPRIAIGDALAVHNCNRQAILAYTHALSLSQRDDLRATIQARIREIEKKEANGHSRDDSCPISLSVE